MEHFLRLKMTLSMSLLYVLFFFGVVSGKCPNDWFDYQNERCIKFYNTNTNHKVASHVCGLLHDGKLVEISSIEDQQLLSVLVFDLFGLSGSLWVGGQSIESNNCTSFAKEGFINGSCEDTLPFTCEMLVQPTSIVNTLPDLNKVTTDVHQCIERQGDIESALSTIRDEVSLLKSYCTTNTLRIEKYVKNAHGGTRDIDAVLMNLIDDVSKCAVPATAIRTPFTGNLTIAEGESITLTCTPFGNPTPHVKWYKVTPIDQSEKELDNSNTLLINKSSRSHQGGYTCHSYNGIGNPFKGSFEVNITFHPNATAVDPVIYTGSRQMASLQANVDSNPGFVSFWFFAPTDNLNYTSLVAGTKYSMIQNETHTNLNISEVNTKLDLGYYKVVMRNSEGEGELIFQLKGSPPTNPILFGHFNVTDETSELTFKFTSFSPLLEYKFEIREAALPYWFVLPILMEPSFDASTNTYIQNFTATRVMAVEKEYEARVSSKNEFGWSNVSKTVDLKKIMIAGKVAKYRTGTDCKYEHTADRQKRRLKINELTGFDCVHIITPAIDSAIIKLTTEFYEPDSFVNYVEVISDDNQLTKSNGSVNPLTLLGSIFYLKFQSLDETLNSGEIEIIDITVYFELQ